MAIEFSELQAVDFAFGAFVLDAFVGLSADVGPKQWREFLARENGRKVWRTDADTPQEFLQEIGKSGKNERLVSGKIINLPQLPVVYYFRKPGINNGDDRSFASCNVWDDALLKSYRLTRLPVFLEYVLVLAAWDKLSLDKMQLAWYAYITKHKRFVVPYGIGGGVFDVPAWVADSKTIQFSDASIPKTDGRIYAVSTTVEVQTMILYGASLSEETIPHVVTLEGVWKGFSCAEFQKNADPMTTTEMG